MTTTGRVYLIYDQRALSGSTDDALVMVTCESVGDAKDYADDFSGCPVYSYDCTGPTLEDERLEFILGQAA